MKLLLIVRRASLLFLIGCATASNGGSSNANDAHPDRDADLQADASARSDGQPADARALPDAHLPTDITLTQVSSNTLATSTLACGAGNATAKQAYYRVFDLAELGIVTPLTLVSVAFGVQSASGAQTITVNIGTYAGPPGATLNVGGGADDWAAGNVTALATATQSVTDADSGMIVSVPIAATIPGSSQLIIEVRSPQDSGSVSFFLGASNGTETTPGFFWSPTCDANPPGTPAELGEGVVPFVITATGTY